MKLSARQLVKAYIKFPNKIGMLGDVVAFAKRKKGFGIFTWNSLIVLIGNRTQPNIHCRFMKAPPLTNFLAWNLPLF